MQNFVDSTNAFKFPTHLFPSASSASPATAAVLETLPTVDERRARLLAETPSEQSLGSGVLEWCRGVLAFHELWSPMPADVLDLVKNLLLPLARSGDDEAAYILGKSDMIDAGDRRKFLRQALKSGIPGSWYHVAINASERGDMEQALSRFQRGADRGDSACLYMMGLAHMQAQFGLERNVERGLNLIELSLPGASTEFPRAPYLLGKIWVGEGGHSANGLAIDGLEGHVPANKHGSGIELIAQSARLGFSPAMMRMSEAYLGTNTSGEGSQSAGGERGFDAAIALRYLSLAACQDTYRRFRGQTPILGGKPESQIVKWLLCGYENVIAKSEEWAYTFAEVGALDQDSAALFALAYFSEVGIATPQDTAKASALYELSSARGFEPATARLKQLKTGTPSLRRALTKRDHENRMQKHSAALVQGTLNATDAINDESTLDPAAPVDEKPLEKPVEKVPTNETAPDLGPVPPFPGALKEHARTSSKASLIKPVLPYPVDDGDTNSVTSTGNSSIATSTNASITPSPSTNLVYRNGPAASSGSLPYPDSPERPFHTPPPAVPAGAPLRDLELEKARVSHSSSAASLGPSRPLLANPYQATETSRISSQGPQGPAPGSSPGQFQRPFQGSPQGSPQRPFQGPFQGSPPRQRLQGPFQGPPQGLTPGQRPLQGPLLQQRPLQGPPQEFQGSPQTFQGPPQGFQGPPQTFQGPPQTLPGPPQSGSALTGPVLRPVAPQSGSALTGPVLRPVGPPTGTAPPVTGRETRTHSRQSSSSQLVSSSRPVSADNFDLPAPSRPSSRPTSGPGSRPASRPSSRPSSQPPSRPPSRPQSGPPVEKSFESPSRPPSLPQSSPDTDDHAESSDVEAPRRRPVRRPLSVQLMENMRIFSHGGSSSDRGSDASIDLSASSTHSASPSMSTARSSTASLNPPNRSSSPLRKIFGSTPQQRAAARSADRRNFTEAALAELASAPKVPVQPIKNERVPGVAYTFEEMGVKTVPQDSNEKCLMM